MLTVTGIIVLGDLDYSILEYLHHQVLSQLYTARYFRKDPDILLHVSVCARSFSVRKQSPIKTTEASKLVASSRFESRAEHRLS